MYTYIYTEYTCLYTQNIWHYIYIYIIYLYIDNVYIHIYSYNKLHIHILLQFMYIYIYKNIYIERNISFYTCIDTYTGTLIDTTQNPPNYSNQSSLPMQKLGPIVAPSVRVETYVPTIWKGNINLPLLRDSPY